MKKFDISEMSYSELVAKNIALQEDIKNKMEEAYALQLAIKDRREEEMKRAFEELLKNFSATKEELMKLFYGEDVTTVSVENTPDSEKEPLSLPEPQEVTPVQETVFINTADKESIWNHPALLAPYNPKVCKEKENASSPDKTTVEKSEEDLPTMESLLSDVPEYKEFYTPKTPVKKSNRSLLTMDELLSGDPINRILCLGNEEPKGKAFRQHTRINHVGGIIPTETATGKTGVYIPPTPTLAA